MMGLITLIQEIGIKLKQTNHSETYDIFMWYTVNPLNLSCQSTDMAQEMEPSARRTIYSVSFQYRDADLQV